jgi:hypothetical protein
MREDKAYAKCFTDSSKGHAVFKYEVADEIRPGACGYFDYDGSVSWNPTIVTFVSEAFVFKYISSLLYLRDIFQV